MQCVFTGPPRVGKSSFWKRIQGIIPDKLLPSTDITSSDGSSRIDIRGSCGFSIHVSVQGWRKLQAEEEMEGFISLVTQQGNPFVQESIVEVQSNIRKQTQEHPESMGTELEDANTPNYNESAQRADSAQRTESAQRTDSAQRTESAQRAEDSSHTDSEDDHGGNSCIPKLQKDVALPFDPHLPSASAVLNQALINMHRTQLNDRMDSASYVTCTVTGGQPEYQELLSLLIAAYNAVYIIFNLEHDLQSIQALEYLPSVNDDPVTYESPHSVGEMLYQSLVSVPIHTFPQGQTSNTSEESMNHSYVFFIGTHKDKIDSMKLEAMNRDLIELIQHTPQYKVQFCSSGGVIFAVDNFSSLQKDEDFVVIHRATQRLLYGSPVRVKAPTSWLFTGVVLQNLSETQPIVSFSQCQEIARQCGIEPNSLRSCFKFLHRTMGAIRYYATEHLHNVVIHKPQAVINALSQLMRRGFLKPVTLKAIINDDDISDTILNFKFLTRDLLIKIGLDLLLMCPHPNSTAERPMFYLTCMLPMIKENTIVADERSSVYFMLEENILPVGLSRATITALVHQQVDAKPPWIINYDRLFRNSLEFSLRSPAISFNMKCSTKHICLTVLKPQGPMSDVCADVCAQIESVMAKVLTLYQYGCAKSPTVAFTCPLCDFGSVTPHYATRLSEDKIQCTHTKNCSNVPPELRHWILVSSVRV